MTRDNIIRMAREAGLALASFCRWSAYSDDLERFAALVAAEKEQQMLRDGYRQCAKEQRTTQFCGLLDAAVKAEREACAKVCEEKQTYSMPIPCPDGIEGCCVAHVVPARREKTGQECAAAIRARGEA